MRTISSYNFSEKTGYSLDVDAVLSVVHILPDSGDVIVEILDESGNGMDFAISKTAMQRFWIDDFCLGFTFLRGKEGDKIVDKYYIGRINESELTIATKWIDNVNKFYSLPEMPQVHISLKPWSTIIGSEVNFCEHSIESGYPAHSVTPLRRIEYEVKDRIKLVA